MFLLPRHVFSKRTQTNSFKVGTAEDSYIKHGYFLINSDPDALTSNTGTPDEGLYTDS